MDQAAIRTAELNLGYTEIRAPFAGPPRPQPGAGRHARQRRAARRSTRWCSSIRSTSPSTRARPISPTSRRRSGRQGRGRGSACPAETEAHHKGELTFIDNVVDRATGTITARATIANADFTLLPGQYVRVRLHLRDEPDALLVPQTALGSSQLGKYVYVVGADNKAEQRLVTLGPTDGDLVAVMKGVTEGDQVITGNLQKIGPGAPVQPLPAKPQSDS